MSPIQFLAEWAIRSSVLLLGGALLLWALRVKDASVRLAVWTAMLCGSLMIPVLMWAVPQLPVTVSRVVVNKVETPPTSPTFEATVPGATLEMRIPAKGFDWARAAVILYAVVAAMLLLRLAIGLAISLRMLRASRPVDEIDVRESDAVTSPLVLGIVRPVIVLPLDWPEWDEAKLTAVLAHERSHITRRDPAVQLIGAIHRALLWHSPLSWFLLTRIVRAAEEASDAAALRATSDRALYARVLLEFIARGGPRVRWLGVSMARYGSIDRRIQRILDGTTLARSLTRWSRAAIVVLAVPLTYVIAAARPQTAVQAIPSAPPKGGVAAGVVNGIPGGVIQGVPGGQPGAPASEPLLALGSVTATTVTVHPRIEGQLLSVTFKEGADVHEGDVLATIDAKSGQLPLDQAKADLLRDQTDFNVALQRGASQIGPPLDAAARQVRQAAIKVDEARIAQAELQLSYANVKAPISGVTGLRLVDPGNFVRPSDGIVVITQLQPITVIFTVAEDFVPRAISLLQSGAAPPVEAWNREMKKIATGRLVAIDNQIDRETGTVKLKAVFDNKDRTLYPNQFVNVVMRAGKR